MLFHISIDSFFEMKMLQDKYFLQKSLALVIILIQFFHDLDGNFGEFEKDLVAVLAFESSKA